MYNSLIKNLQWSQCLTLCCMFCSCFNINAIKFSALCEGNWSEMVIIIIKLCKEIEKLDILNEEVNLLINLISGSKNMCAVFAVFFLKNISLKPLLCLYTRPIVHDLIVISNQNLYNWNRQTEFLYIISNPFFLFLFSSWDFLKLYRNNNK